MFNVSEPFKSAPQAFKTSLQKTTYAVLAELGITFERVDTDEAITMNDCKIIEEKLKMKMVKTLFLCNRHKTVFYIFITVGNKPFSSKDFSKALGVARTSFAPKELFEEKLKAKIGAATIFSILADSQNEIQVVFDNDILKEKFYGCSDGTTTGYMKIQTDEIINKLLKYAKHDVRIICI